MLTIFSARPDPFTTREDVKLEDSATAVPVPATALPDPPDPLDSLEPLEKTVIPVSLVSPVVVVRPLLSPALEVPVSSALLVPLDLLELQDLWDPLAPTVSPAALVTDLDKDHQDLPDLLEIPVPMDNPVSPEHLDNLELLVDVDVDLLDQLDDQDPWELLETMDSPDPEEDRDQLDHPDLLDLPVSPDSLVMMVSLVLLDNLDPPEMMLPTAHAHREPESSMLTDIVPCLVAIVMLESIAVPCTDVSLPRRLRFSF